MIFKIPLLIGPLVTKSEKSKGSKNTRSVFNLPSSKINVSAWWDDTFSHSEGLHAQKILLKRHFPR